MANYDELINGYFDDMLTDEQFASLSVWLRADRKNIERFMRASFLHSRVRDVMQQEDILGFLLADESDESSRSIDPKNVLGLIEEDEAIRQQRAREAAIEKARIALEEDRRRRRMQELADRRPRVRQVIEIPRSVGYLAVGSIVALVLLLANKYISTPSDQHPANQQAANVEQTQQELALRPRVAEVVNASGDAHWSNGLQAVTPGASLNAGVHNLESGIIELAFDSGARIVVESPAKLELLSSDRVRITQGKLVATVPDRALGFTVLSGAAAFVDLGTEFGVDAGPDGASSIYVLDGEVALVATPNGDKGSSPSQRLLAGAARKVSADGNQIEELAYDENSFIREVPASQYELAIWKSRPLAYWNFNESRDEQEIVSRGQLQLTGPITTDVDLGMIGRIRSKHDRAAYFSSNNEGICVEGAQQLAFVRNFSIEAWIDPVAAFGTPQRIVSTFMGDAKPASESLDSGFAFGVAPPEFNPQTDTARPQIRLLFTFYSVCDCVATAAVPQQWVHAVVSVDDRGKPTIFLNGQELEVRYIGETSTTADWSWDSNYVAKPSSSPCYIARNPVVANPTFPPEAWQGGIDELVIYDRALSPEEIQLHYEIGLK